MKGYSLSSSDNPQFDSPHVDGEVHAPPPPPDPAELNPVANHPQAGVGLEGSTPIPIAPPDPVWSGWDVLTVAVLTLVTIFILSAGFALAARAFFPRIDLNEATPEIAIAAQFVAYLLIAIFMVMLVEGKYRVRFWEAIHWNWPSSNLPFMGLGVALLLSINVVAHFLPMPKSTPFDQFFLKPRDAVVMSIFAITLGPLMEELFFRGLLYPVLVRRLGVFWGITLTALPFGLIHMFQYGYAWGVVLLIFLMGVVCTVVRWQTESVASSFLVHVGYNATEMFLLMLATGGFRHMDKAMAFLSY